MSDNIYPPIAPVCANPVCNNIITQKRKRDNKWMLHCSKECKCQHNKLKSVDKCKQTCLDRYGAESPLQSKIIQNKIKQTCINKYGVDNPSKSIEVIDKIKNISLENWNDSEFKSTTLNKRIETNLEKYGTKYAQQSIIVKKKIESTCMQKYGVTSTLLVEEIRNNQQETCLKKYGVRTPFESIKIQTQCKNTLDERYGVRFPLQNKEIFNNTKKNFSKFFKTKPYILPSGKIIHIQGYENKALDDLLLTYTEEMIITDTLLIPVINYTNNGKNHKYYPDLFIPHENLLIEVKSTYTAGPRFKDINILKEKACIAAGFNFRWMIY